MYVAILVCATYTFYYYVACQKYALKLPEIEFVEVYKIAWRVHESTDMSEEADGRV